MSASRTFCTFAVVSVLSAPKIYMAGIVKTIAPVDSISGMIGKRSTFVSDTAMIVNVRAAGRSMRFDGRPYMYLSVRKNNRVSPLSQDELAKQEKFAAVASQTRAAMKDPSQVMTLQAEFKAQSKYKTFYSFVWNKKWNAYEG